ncbi:tryptophan--tRNA ligase [Pilimelia anulata]|uniref:Tryptophan--tRNA ligase n=1 Tax=Pilimelia anulata TaxID=53371 RepID=A0A8J3B6I9_9ACTN|nr:tryptophan--tRNA ligase [Pilimelia anulata]GGJ88361.1 tryptophan--tRNA ligase [Pilimelia anulata]
MGSTARKVSLTGIKPTGEPHLGNYIGAILPALELADSYDSVYFIADYHALTTIRDRDLLRHYTRSVAATWLAAGLDPDRTTFYRQSDLTETFELAWVLSCVTGKGLMNRAHAYKAVRDRNREAGKDDLDAGVNMGLFNYPVLMAVDILIMDADVVPVGRDQLQHVEYAADIAGAFNAVYGERFAFKVPAPIVPAEGTAHTLPGTDGRKMSKSYGNTIPLFAPEAALRKTIRRIPTDSVPVEAPKDPDSSAVFTLLERFGDPAVVAETRAALLAGGVGWGDVKNHLAEALITRFSPLRDRYEALIAPGSELDDLLAHGADKARKQTRPLLERVRDAIGIG